MILHLREGPEGGRGHIGVKSRRGRPLVRYRMFLIFMRRVYIIPSVVRCRARVCACVSF